MLAIMTYRRQRRWYGMEDCVTNHMRDWREVQFEIMWNVEYNMRRACILFVKHLFACTWVYCHMRSSRRHIFMGQYKRMHAGGACVHLGDRHGRHCLQGVCGDCYRSIGDLKRPRLRRLEAGKDTAPSTSANCDRFGYVYTSKEQSEVICRSISGMSLHLSDFASPGSSCAHPKSICSFHYWIL